MNAHPRPYYYLENFSVALNWLCGRYRDLLIAEEQKFVNDFSRLPIRSAALAVRMVMRKGDLFRTSKLAYLEIGCPKQAAVPLIELGWLDPHPAVSFTDLCRLLRKSEISSALGLGSAARSVRKADLAPLAGAAAAEIRPLQQWWPEAPDEFFRVTIAPLCERLRLMFFGNFAQTWSEFVLADLGIFRYERVCLDAGARAFQTREEIEQFNALYRCRELLHAAVPAPLEDVRAALPEPLTSGSWIEVKRAKLLFAIGQRYEKERDLSQALQIYRDCRHPEARIRTIRVLEKQQRFDAAAQLLSEVQNAPASELEVQLSGRIRRRLSRKLGINTAARTRKHEHGWTDLELQLPLPDPAQRVELAVSEHLSTPQVPVLYVENTLLNSLFGLLCWEAIFSPLPGAFFHAFHAGPADLLEGGFRERRAEQFAACFSQLEKGTYRDTILNTFERKQGIQSPFVAWNWLTRQQIELALQCIPAAHLYKCFERLLVDIRTNRSGLPDLIQLWPDEHRYRLIEVKGPGDRLQDNQIRWLSFCVAQDIPVCVCKVTWRAAL